MTSTILFFIIYIFYINCFPLNGNLQNKANLNGANIFTDTLLVVSEKSLQSNNYFTGQFVSNAETQINPNARAGYGFHNHGNNGIFLYLDIDGTLKYIDVGGVIHQIQATRVN